MDNNIEKNNIYKDADTDLDRIAPGDELDKLIEETADMILSEEQLENKGKLLGHYKSRGLLLRSYVDVYERAIIGKAEMYGYKKLQSIKIGYRYLDWAVVEDNILYLKTKDQKTYRLRRVQQVERIAFLINRQRGESERIGFL